MNISYNWLKEFIVLEESAETLAPILTAAGLEVEMIENFESLKGSLEGIVIGEVLTCEKHPDADKLSITTVDIGQAEPVPIVCGAANVAKSQKVVVATVGAMVYPINGEPFQIKKAKIRGQVSEGMICAEDELSLGNSHEGIMVLTTDLPNGTPASKYFNIEKDKVFVIGLTPNRADAASHWGVARDLKVLLNRDICLPTAQNFKINHQNLTFEVLVENAEACPRYSALSIANVEVKESPEWLKNRLKSIGLTPINNIVDATNYVLHELGQPLHAFDADKIAGKKVIVKTLPKDTMFISLDGKERKLNENDLMICDGEEKGMCIGGVFGGANSGVSPSTKNIFLESAYFSPDYIRKTSQFHGLKTDASFRFERGTNPNFTVEALKRAALLIQEIAGGEIASEVIDIYPNPIPNFEFEVSYKNIDRLIGKTLDRNLIKKILTDLEIKISNETELGFDVSVPPYRVDVQREVDIVEEIARLYGFDNIELSEHLGASYLADFSETDAHKIQYQITQMLASNGLSEMMNNSLTKPAYAAALSSLKPENNVEILNKLSEELAVMRQTLLFSGLEVLAYNINRRQKDVKFFEFGKIYHLAKIEGEKAKNQYKEHLRLSIFLTGNQKEESWRIKSQNTDFHDLATAVQKILQRLNITDFQTERIQDDIFSDGLVYIFKQKQIVKLGLVHKNLLKLCDIKQGQVWYADLDWEYLLKNYSHKLQYQEVSKFPEVRRDLSVVLDKQISFQAIEALARKTERKLLKAINVFDVYEGANLGEGKKSYSISFTLEDETQTLTDKMIDKTMERLMQSLEKELGAVIRK